MKWRGNNGSLPNGKGGSARTRNDSSSRPADVAVTADKQTPSKAVGAIVSLSERLSALHKANPWHKYSVAGIETPKPADTVTATEVAPSHQPDAPDVPQAVAAEQRAAQLEAKSTIELETEAKPEAKFEARSEGKTNGRTNGHAPAEK